MISNVLFANSVHFIRRYKDNPLSLCLQISLHLERKLRQCLMEYRLNKVKMIITKIQKKPQDAGSLSVNRISIPPFKDFSIPLLVDNDLGTCCSCWFQTTSSKTHFPLILLQAVLSSAICNFVMVVVESIRLTCISK